MATLDDFAKQKADYFKQKRQEQLGQVNAAAQEQQDVIQRRFASLGAQGSGAQFGIQQKAAEQAAAQRRNVEQDVLGQEVQAMEPDLQRRFAAEQAQLGREYGTQERLGSEKFQTGQLTQQQQFAGEQAKLGREFTTAERLAQQAYGSDEAGKARQFQAGQQLLQNTFASAEAALGRTFSAEERAAQNKFLAGESAASRDLQSRLAADDLALKKSLADMQNARDEKTYQLALRQYQNDLETTEFNKMLSLIMSGMTYERAIAVRSNEAAKATPIVRDAAAESLIEG